MGEQLLKALEAEDPSLRAAAAYALSRVPDREKVDDRVKQTLPKLLADEALPVRVAGVMLAEAVLGERLEFDPEADAEARGKAAASILSRL